MQKKFEIHRTKIKGGCQSGRKVVPQDSKSDLPLAGHEKMSLKKYTIHKNTQLPIKNGPIPLPIVTVKPKQIHKNILRLYDPLMLR